jgi:hypothetical protein
VIPAFDWQKERLKPCMVVESAREPASNGL